MGIRRRRRRDAPRRARRPGLARAHPGLVLASVEHGAAARSACSRRTPTACRTCTAWSGNGPRTTPRCWSSADNRNQGDPDTAKFCGAGALSMDDRDNYAVLMRVAMLSSLEAPTPPPTSASAAREATAMRTADDDALTIAAAARCCRSPSPRAAAPTRRAAAGRFGLPAADAAAPTRHGRAFRLARSVAASRSSSRCSTPRARTSAR